MKDKKDKTTPLKDSKEKKTGTQNKQNAVQPDENFVQKDIENLLGEASTIGNSDLEKNILFSKRVYYERLPMLDVVFDRFMQMFSAAMRNFTLTNIDIIPEKIDAIRMGSYLSTLEKPSLIGIFKAEQWSNQALLFINNTFAHALFETLLGNRSGADVTKEKSSYTLIEQSLIKRVVEVILTNLTSAFEPIADILFRFNRLEFNPRLALITRPNNIAVILSFYIKMNDRGGKVEILLPYETIEPIRDVLLQNFMGEKFGDDTIWEKHLSNSVWHTDVDVHACFPQVSSCLADVLNWDIGSKLLLNVTPSDPIELRCGDHLLGTGKIGQKTGQVALKLENVYIKGDL